MLLYGSDFFTVISLMTIMCPSLFF